MKYYPSEGLWKYSPSSLKRDDFTSILWAAGSTFANGELKLIDDEIHINLKGLQRLRSIWKAPTRTFNDPMDNSEHPIRW